MRQGTTEAIQHDSSIRRRARLDQRGSVMITMAVSIVALFSFAIVAIDGAILMTTKTQLQNAADAACLACASGLGIDEDADDRMEEATKRAKAFAFYNKAVQDVLTPVVIYDDDIEFLDANGNPTNTNPIKCRVTTHRTVAHGDPLRTYFLKIIDLAVPNTADVKADATAELFDICGTNCTKPWAIPDRWADANGNGEYDFAEPLNDTNGNGIWDPGEIYTDSNGNGSWDDDEFYDPLITGYLPPGDLGTILVLHSGTPPGPIASGQYWSVDLPPLGNPEQPPLTGGDYYREWIRSCSPYTVSPGDSLQLEPGQMVGPTIQGVLDLIGLDPLATWNPATNSIVNSAYGLSPRVALVPFYDPYFPPKSGRKAVTVTKIGAFFLESVGPGSNVNARFMKIGVPGAPCDDPNAPPTFITGLRLVE